ncbi:hypothetical protein HUK80_08025 [Flavobacterium sp. MAH-1]|uniref:Uncharacterized protein n=1 Tax=Flavobacterium agri TaxID=2743471 RepID=A0A7Y9C5C2_9FLAO|nr:hypothetical protein [Flavobacterium agri]NUY80836.1 hypothetical protein [Flavobacterium agri]NYA70860.1 hypothetical protein [Flavobacterium agri]
MGKFLRHILLFLIATVAMMAVLDVCYTQIFETSPPRSKFQLLRNLKGQKIGYAFLGSSRVDNDIVPELIEQETGKKSLNLGFQASKMYDIHTILRLLKEYDVQSDRVFVQMDYTFNAGGHSNMMLHEVLPFIRDNEVTRRHFAVLPDHDALYYVPFYRYAAYDFKIGFREMMMNVLHKRTALALSGGYHPVFGHEQKENHNTLPDTIWKSNPYFDSIRSFADKNRLDVTYFCAPFDTKTKNIGYVKLLKGKIPNLRDYSQSIRDTMSFANHFHLNDVGAREFTTQFIRNELKKKAP